MLRHRSPQHIDDIDCPSLFTSALFSRNSLSSMGLTQSSKAPISIAIEAGRREQPYKGLLLCEIPPHRTYLAMAQSRPVGETASLFRGTALAALKPPSTILTTSYPTCPSLAQP